VVPGAGHMTALERPAETAALLDAFLGRIAQRDAPG
jgi:pimeloyl-ACP methyl ester carboxylesterase